MYLRHELRAVNKTSTESHNVNIVVLRADDREFGLVVDEINDTQEIVVKPLGKQLKSINAYAVATIMGNGKVALILDVLGLAQRANLVSGRAEKTVSHTEQSVSIQQKQNALAVMPFSSFSVARAEEWRWTSVWLRASRNFHAIWLRSPATTKWFSIAERSCRSSECPRSSSANNGECPNLCRIPCMLWSIPKRAEASGWSSIGSSTSWKSPSPMQRQTSRKGIGSAVIQKHTTDILDVPAWSPHRKWPRCSAQHRVKGGAAVANTQQFCTFFWHDQCFGVPVEQVQEVIRYEEMTRVPLGPDVARASSICVDRLTNMLASRISSKSELPVRECVSGEAVAAGHAVIAPGDFHMAVQQEVGSIRLKTHQGPRENFCRPSVDVLFRSVAQVYGERAFDGNGPGRIERLRNVKGSGSSSLCSR